MIVGGWLLSSAVLLGAYPGESLDIFDYLFRGRLQVALGVSPLATPPALFANQLFYPYVNWTTYVDTYGPLWEYASGAVAAMVGAVACDCPASLASYVLGYRLLAIGLAGLCGVLIYTITAYRSPQLAPAALLAWLWNPLLLTATAIGAHNDMLMLVLILAAVLLFQRQRWLLGLLALALAAHVKLTALLLLPVLGLWLARRCGWWRAIRISSVAGVTGAGAFLAAVCPTGRLGHAAAYARRACALDRQLTSICHLLGAPEVCGLVGSCGMARNNASCHRAVFRACRGAAGAVLARDWEYSQTG